MRRYTLCICRLIINISLLVRKLMVEFTRFTSILYILPVNCYIFHLICMTDCVRLKRGTSKLLERVLSPFDLFNNYVENTWITGKVIITFVSFFFINVKTLLHQVVNVQYISIPICFYYKYMRNWCILCCMF